MIPLTDNMLADARELAGNWHDWDSFAPGLDDADDLGIVILTNRDADCLTASNAAAIIQALEEADLEHAHWAPYSARHWGVGWVEGITVAPLDGDTPTPAYLALRECAERLEQYPVLDEEDFSRREFDDAIETLQNCYSHLIRADAPDTWPSDVAAEMSNYGGTDSWHERDVAAAVDSLGYGVTRCDHCEEEVEEAGLCDHCAIIVRDHADGAHTLSSHLYGECPVCCPLDTASQA